MLQLIKRSIREKIEHWLWSIWTPRVGDYIEFVHQPRRVNDWKHSSYLPQPGDRGVITQTFKNYWDYEGYIISMDNGEEINYEFPRKDVLKLIRPAIQRKIAQ